MPDYQGVWTGDGNLPKDGSPFDPNTARLGYVYINLDSGRRLTFVGKGPYTRRGEGVYVFQARNEAAALAGIPRNEASRRLVFDLQFTSAELRRQSQSNQGENTMNQPTKSILANSRSIDPNIAAIMRDDATTVEVNFGITCEGHYTYITSIKLEVDDYVVVPNKSSTGFTVGQVVAVHDDLQLPPNSDITFKWVVSKVDTTAYKENMERNATIEQAVAEAYQTNARKSMRAAVMAGMDSDAAARLQAAITGTNLLESLNG